MWHMERILVGTPLSSLADMASSRLARQVPSQGFHISWSLSYTVNISPLPFRRALPARHYGPAHFHP